MIPFALGLSLSAWELELAASVEKLAEDKIDPIAEDADGGDELHPGVVDLIRRSGLFRHFVPEEYGGAGLSVTALALIRERLAYHSVATDEFFVSQGIPAQPIALFGSHEQKTEHLSALLDGRRLFSFCLTEPTAGSDVLGIRTTARAVGDGYVLDGAKRYAFAGNVADTLLVFAKTGEAGERGNITAFLIDKPDSGVTATFFPLMAPGPEWELQFEECFIPSQSVIGEIGKGAQIALGNLDRLRPSVGAAAIGMAQRALDEAAAYTQHRHAFDRPLSMNQGLRFEMAERAAEIEAARSLVYGAARFADTTDDTRLVRTSSAKAKLFATEAAQRAIDTSLQFHGGVGLARGSVTERLYRAIRATRIYEGSAEVMKIVISRSILGQG
jgi:acyl-CoA dehydrogenase